MTLNASGAISLAGATAGQSIAVELGLGTTTQISLNDTAVRTLAGVPSGAIIMPTNFYGKSNRVSISYTFTSNTSNASLVVSSIGGYSAGKTDITVTVNSGIYLWASTTGNYGLNLTGGTTGDTVTLVNNGYIMGAGGNGGSVVGGPAFNVGIGVNITVNNTNASAYIGGGGGGGGAGFAGGGGGAGGGIGQDGGSGPAAGGAIGASGADGNNGGIISGCPCIGCPGSAWYPTGGGGGRIFPGTGGAGGSGNYGGNGGGGFGGGSGGGGGGTNYGGANAGGSANAAGGASINYFGFLSGGGGGGWGASGGSGGAGGKAVNLNGKTVTWTSGNTTRVYGAVS